MHDENECLLLLPDAKVAAHWNGALRSRLDQRPLEEFIRRYARVCDPASPDSVVDNVACAGIWIIEPVLPHRGDAWSALLHAPYYDALGQAMLHISRGLANLIRQPGRWRVAALLGMGRLLTPVLGMDLAASTAAASMAAFEKLPRGEWVFDEVLAYQAARAVKSSGALDLMAVRKLISRGLSSVVEGGAATLPSAPLATTIWAEPPSNH